MKAVAVMSKPGCNCGGQMNEEDCLIQHILEVTVNSYAVKNLSPLISNQEVKIFCNTYRVNDSRLANLLQWCGEMPINK